MHPRMIRKYSKYSFCAPLKSKGVIDKQTIVDFFFFHLKEIVSLTFICGIEIQ